MFHPPHVALDPAPLYLPGVMRRTTLGSRSITILFALWFAMVLGDPGVLHACPMHGALDASSTPAASHAMHAGAAMPDSGHSHEHGAHTGCTCVGHCCATPGTTPASTAATFSLVAHVVETSARREFPRDDIPRSPDLRLPLATAPPRA
jgi:hypothetical protein